MTDQTEREKFERYLTKLEGFDHYPDCMEVIARDRNGDTYRTLERHMRWHTWQARAALDGGAVSGDADHRVTISLSEKEARILKSMSAEREMSIPAIFRQAVRLYQDEVEKIKAGETKTWSGDARRAREFAGDLAIRTQQPAPQDNSAIEDLLEELIERVQQDRFVDYATPAGKSRDPDPQIEVLRSKINAAFLATQEPRG